MTGPGEAAGGDRFAKLYQDLELNERRKVLMAQKLKAKHSKKQSRQLRRERFKSSVAQLAMTVAQVHIEGLERTRNDLVVGIVEKIFYGSNYLELAQLIKEAQLELKRLGCFQRVDVSLDINGQRADCLDVCFQVSEKDRLGFGFDWLTTNYNDTKLTLSAGMPNLLGRGERLQLSLSRTWLQNSEHSMEVIIPNLDSVLGPLTLMSGLHYDFHGIPWCQLERRFLYWNFITIQNAIPWLESKTELRIGARRLGPASSTLSFAHREECGYSLPMSLEHQLTVDSRDNRVLPRSGWLFKWCKEIFGSPGNVHLFKHSLAFAVYAPLWKNLVLSWSGKIGAATPLNLRDMSENHMNSSDLFTFQNPLQCRGWSNASLRDVKLFHGSQSQVLASSSLKISSPIPMLRGTQTWLYNNVRTHLFLDVGALGNVHRLQPGYLLSGKWMEWTHAGFGMGLVFKLGQIGRAEVNYVFPVRSATNIRSRPNLQFGMAIDFL
ncbi:sorting and assembly machinery component 50 homolog [Tigriopus californicus]|uniref:sorting and assembly machinery component 50 homolog n=1 Tax=Tigriopus californicus TaxID=6832 RepID=UPI0027DA2424|nr:sorting and assembly machinery component 50 homolog [Tigriopus californicus]XP_059092622.1 sorting and assembly machinery component 50 homolog [Tigriopus californicus]|eukprot:TCALIF_04937-PA protein Name:"Similar to Samm50 Sorting and assembly machinery component 50 homolog (Mus musculus)" AED:0.18 eAED:0.18 QI:0/-1/0/1/-1/1/1/0/491